MKIIEATEKDIKTLIRLNNEVQEFHILLAPDKYKKINEKEITKWFTEIIKDKNTKILIALIDSQPIGYLIVRIVQREENTFKYAQRYIEIDQIAIKKEFRNNGYGRKFIEETKKYAKYLNINSISLFVFAKNSSAIKAYERIGFEQEGIKMTLNLNHSSEPHVAQSLDLNVKQKRENQ